MDSIHTGTTDTGVCPGRTGSRLAGNGQWWTSTVSDAIARSASMPWDRRESPGSAELRGALVEAEAVRKEASLSPSLAAAGMPSRIDVAGQGERSCIPNIGSAAPVFETKLIASHSQATSRGLLFDRPAGRYRFRCPREVHLRIAPLDPARRAYDSEPVNPSTSPRADIRSVR